MSSRVALQAMLDRLLSRFALPLVVGGEVLVSYPIGPGAVEHFMVAEPTDPEVGPAIVRGRTDVLRDLVSLPSVRDLAPNELALLSALHNVLLAAHQGVAEGLGGAGRWQRCLGWGLEHLGRVPPSRGADVALARHSLLHGVVEMVRRDVVVRTRLGERRYLGRPPPARALVWPRLRGLSTRKNVARLPDVVPNDEAREALSAVLDRSPLTCLLAMPYGAAGGSVVGAELQLSDEVAAVLRSPALCRAVTYRHLELGFGRVGPPLTEAVLGGLHRSASVGAGSAEAARTAFGLRYLVNLQLTHCWTEADPADLLSPFDQGWGGAAAEGARPLFFGWLAAALSRGDRLGAPWPPSPELGEAERLYRERAASVAGPALEDASRQLSWLAPPDRAAEPARR